jgi:hypothetical protein
MMSMSDIEIDDGILIQNNFLSKEHCDYVIDYFEKTNSFGFSYPRKDPHHVKDDTSISLMDTDVVIRNYKAQWNIFGGLSEQIKKMFELYKTKYSVLQSHNFQIFDIKIQKSEVGQGYHVWHDDGGGRDPRATTFIIYLNDVEEGGETELLYKPKRIKSEAGKMFMFPANYMWTHRGNPPISNTKYILTGWIEYV